VARRPQPIDIPMNLKDQLHLQALVMESLRAWMRDHGFLETFHPEITRVTGSCETIANIFVLQERELLSLRQTVQLLMEELLIRSQLPRMFASGRSFRREARQDGRHLQDFELFEWEALDIDLAKLVQYNRELIEQVIKDVLRSNILERDRQRVLYYWWDLWHDERVPHVITYERAIEVLRSTHLFKVHDETTRELRLIQWGDDLNSNAERLLTQDFGILQVTHYPEQIKFFNMERSRDQKSHRGCVECVDMLLPYAGETIGGSAREYEHAILCERLYDSLMLKHLKELNRRRGGTEEEVEGAFQSYLGLFQDTRYPRAGAGLGLGRLFQFLVASPVIIAF